MRRFSWLVVLAAAGCGGATNTTEVGQQAPSPEAVAAGGALLLKQEPAGARGVKEVKAGARTGDEVVMAGRVGGAAKPFTKDRAVFLLVGENLKPAMECDCPWDFCESPTDELKASRATVKFTDARGETLPVDARDAFGIKELSRVVVTGKAVRDDAGNLTVVATGLYVKEK